MNERQLNLFAQGSAGEGSQEPAEMPCLCWTRMQAESGEQLAAIIRRKEIERRIGGGTFFWGIGNALNADGLRNFQEVPVIFSRMLSKPKEHDESPHSVLVWRKYASGARVYELPPHVLITSRAYTKSGPKNKHFALVCRSSQPLQLSRRRPFDPAAYRNISERGQSIGFSQVTAFVRQVARESKKTRYYVDLEAILLPPFFVQLLDPVLMLADQKLDIQKAAGTAKRWTELVMLLRAA